MSAESDVRSIGIVDAIRALNEAVASLRDASHSQHLDVQTKIATLTSRLDSTLAMRADLDTNGREIARISHLVETLKEQRKDHEDRLRPVESTRSQALLVAAVGSMVMAGLVSMLMRGAH